MRWISAAIVTMMTVGMIGGVALFAIIHHYGSDLPTLEKLKNYEPPTATRLYAGNGRLLTEYATQRRIYVPLTAIPKRVQQSFIAAEDKNFYSHPGVDFFGILRAMITNFKNIGTDARLVGGSTITQQVVKNFLLTNEQSFERKIKEALLAFRINRVLSKDTVLELYLNEIYLGGGAYGVASAALHYFNKSLDELTLEEAAYLAALPKAPNNYHPVEDYDEAKGRRDWVISRMEEDDYITEAEAEAAQAEPLIARTRDETEFAVAAFFAEEVRRELVKMYGSDVLYEGGLTVHTTVDPTMQRYARDALRDTLIDYDRRHGYRGAMGRVAEGAWLTELQAWKKNNAVPLIENQQVGVITSQQNDYARVGFDSGLDGTIPLDEMKWASSSVGKTQDVVSVGDIVLVSPTADGADTYRLEQVPKINGAMMVMDPHTGRVLAMVGGYSYENTEFNRATQAMRQPGSSFKPIVYLSALEAGFTPSTIVMDAPIELTQGPGLPMWRPKNYGGDYLGPATLRKGLETSRNVMTVRLALQIGIERIVSTAQRLGFYKELDPYFSIVLGAKETTLERVVNSYSMLVNGGKKVRPVLIERIQNRKGETIYRRDTRRCENCNAGDDNGFVSPTPPIPADIRDQVIDPKVAYQMVSLMEGVVQRGTAVRARKLGRPLAGKTGTTNDSRDAWFVGYTPDLVAGVYTGFDNPKPLGRRETGGKVALPAFISFMEKALADKPSTPFRIPPGMRLVKLDARTGQAPTASTPANEIILEAFLPGQIPGSRPVLDVSKPVFDRPMGGRGYGYGGGGTWGRESVNGVDTQLLPDASYDNGLITPNRNPNSPNGQYAPAPQRQQPQQPSSDVTGTGGLY